MFLVYNGKYDACVQDYPEENYIDPPTFTHTAWDDLTWRKMDGLICE
jgi:hypothetical protein